MSVTSDLRSESFEQEGDSNSNVSHLCFASEVFTRSSSWMHFSWLGDGEEVPCVHEDGSVTKPLRLFAVSITLVGKSVVARHGNGTIGGTGRHFQPFF